MIPPQADKYWGGTATAARNDRKRFQFWQGFVKV
jgi:hypothetical protein